MESCGTARYDEKKVVFAGSKPMRPLCHPKRNLLARQDNLILVKMERGVLAEHLLSATLCSPDVFWSD